MKKVNFFSVQVKYSGSFEDYSKDQLFEMAKAKQDHGVDCIDETIEVEDDTIAKQLDGKVVIDNTYPCNKICTVGWSYIAEEEGD